MKKLNENSHPIIVLILLISLGFIWGSGYTLARFATTQGVSPLGYAFWQSLGPACLMSIFALSARLVWPLSWQHVRFYFICSLLGIVLPNTNMYFAAPHLPAGILAVIVNTVPIFTYVLAFICRQESFNYSRLLGVMCGIAGLMLILAPQTTSLSETQIPWALMALLTPVCFALTAIYIARQHWSKIHPFISSASMMLLSTILLTPIVFAKGDFYLFHWPLLPRDGAILLEVILSSLGYLIMFQLLKMAGAVYYSFVGCIVALTGLFWGWVVFAEVLSLHVSIAVFLILLALILLTTTQIKNRR